MQIKDPGFFSRGKIILPPSPHITPDSLLQELQQQWGPRGYEVYKTALIGADLDTFAVWLGLHGNALLMILFVIALYHHALLGVMVVIEDYVHHETLKTVSLLGVRFTAILSAVSCILAVLRLATGF